MAERDGKAPRTVIRPALRPHGGGALPALARPLIELAGRVARAPRPDPTALAAEARRLVAQFETEARRAGLAAEAVLDARDALAALLGARGASNPAMPARDWRRELRRILPVGEATAAALRARRDAADRAGPGARDLARFLGHCLEAVEAAQRAAPEPARKRGTRATLAVALFFVALAGWAGWAEWRYARDLLAGFPDTEAVVAAGRDGAPERRAATLDRLAAATERIARAAPGSPLGLAHLLGPADPAAAARRRYAAVADALAPGPLGDALELALATEGDPDALYDTLRAWSILHGRAEWRPRFLAGWLLDRRAAFPELAGLAPHVLALSGAVADPAAGSAELLAQARTFGADGSPAARAFLELARAEEVAALPAWSPVEAAPGLETVLVRRSGRPIAEGPAGLYTAAGWAQARGGGAAAAIARAAAQSAALFGTGQAGAEAEVLAILQRRTLEAWREYLADLRVRPFTDQPSAVLISGRLAVRASPLSALIAEVWRQAGGEDRGRSHPDQLRIAAEFGPAIQFVEQGGMAEISQLFATLNVALAALDADDDLAARGLMDVQGRAASIAALQQAPGLVGQIVEDVLAQTAASSEGVLKRRVTLLWQAQVAPACSAAIAGRYPFDEGPDADLAEVAGQLAPDGTVPAFFREHLAALMETGETPWRWKPEARLSGFTPESAAFFERVAAVGPALFPDGGAPLTLEALAQRGAATVTIGGAAAPVVTSGAPAALNWPGPAPQDGFSIAFDGAAPQGASGPWGLLRYLDGLRLRPRDEGRRFLIDVRQPDARAYLQLSFATAANPVAARPLLRGLVCPAAL